MPLRVPNSIRGCFCSPECLRHTGKPCEFPGTSFASVPLPHNARYLKGADSDTESQQSQLRLPIHQPSNATPNSEHEVIEKRDRQRKLKREINEEASFYHYFGILYIDCCLMKQITSRMYNLSGLYHGKFCTSIFLSRNYHNERDVFFHMRIYLSTIHLLSIFYPSFICLLQFYICLPDLALKKL